VGTGAFVYDLEPHEIRYIYTKSPKQLYTDDHMVIENGILKITLDKLPDPDPDLN
jgi:hypothetical protein